MFKRVLVPITGSRSTLDTLDQAIDLAGKEVQERGDGCAVRRMMMTKDARAFVYETHLSHLLFADTRLGVPFAQEREPPFTPADRPLH